MSNRRGLSPIEKEDSERLRKIWDEKKDGLSLSQQDVADAFGIANQTAISQYLNGRIPLNLEAAIKFSKVLGVSVKDISPRHAQWVLEAPDRVLGNALDEMFAGVEKPFCFVVGDDLIAPMARAGDIGCIATTSVIESDGVYVFNLGKGFTLRHAKISKDKEHVILSANGIDDTKIPLANMSMLSVTGRLLFVLHKV